MINAKQQSRKKILNQAGDTIVEVLVSVMVVGLAIGLAYGVANRSLRGSRQAQERGEALKLAEGQIETLKSKAASDDAQPFPNTPFCIDSNGDIAGHAAGFSYNADVNEDDLSKYGACNPNSGLYNIAIIKTGNDFSVSVRWFSIGNRDKEELKIAYRLYQ